MSHAAQSQVARFTHHGEIGALVAVIRRLSVARSLEEIMATVAHGVRTVLHADGATFVLREADKCHYAEEDAVSPLWKGRRFPLSACISGWCMLHRRPAAIGDIYQDRRIPIDAYRPTFVRSLAMVPVGPDEPIAAVGAYWSQTREIRSEEVDLLQTIANAAALAFAYVQLQQTGAAPGRLGAPAAPAAPAPAPAPPAANQASAPRVRGALARLTEDLRRGRVPPNSPAAYGVAAACAALAAAARLVIEATGAGPLTPFATFYTATLATVLVAGGRAGALAALLGGAAALLGWPHGVAADPGAAALDLLLYFGASGLMIWALERYRRVVRRLADEDARLVTLAREQRHRTENAVSVVESIVRQSLRSDPTAARALNQRIRAGLADLNLGERAAHEPVGVRALLTQALHPFELARFDFAGEDETPVTPGLRAIISLAAHELATNALKYGALSTPDGRVSVSWRFADGRITLRWRETGGPPVEPPRTRGYGSVLLQRLVQANKGAFEQDFQPGGLVSELSLPLEPRRRR